MMHFHAASVAVKHLSDFQSLMVSTWSRRASVMAKSERSDTLNVIDRYMRSFVLEERNVDAQETFETK